MNTFEESLLAVMEARVKTALRSLELRDRFAASDPDVAIEALGNAHEAVVKIAEDIRCLKRLHEMTMELELKGAAE
jgi:hypothetical protein